MSKGTYRLVVWILNAVVAVACLLAIIGYFFAPFWSVNATYTVHAEDLKKMLGSESDLFNVDEVIDEKGLDVPLKVEITMGHLFKSFDSDSKAVVDHIIEGNVDKVVDSLTSTIGSVSKTVVQSAAKKVVKEQVHKQVKDYLQKSTEGITDADVQTRLDNANISDEYIEQKTDELVQLVYSEGGTNVDAISDNVIDTVEDVYGKLKENDPDFADAELTEEDKNAIRDKVNETVSKLADENGHINADELVSQLLLSFLKDQNGDKTGSASAEASGIVSLAAEPNDAADSPSGNTSASDQLKKEVQTYIVNAIPENLPGILVWALRGLILLFFLSSCAWIYILVKLIVKFIKKGEPTVKLKMPIILGWMPFFLLVLAPSIALLILRSTSLAAAGGALEILSSLAISFSSIGWIALACACVCFAISIVYMVFRRMNRNNSDAPEENDAESQLQPAQAEDDEY